MDALSLEHEDRGGLRNCHALALLPLSKKDQSRHLVRVLEAAKQYWNWRVSVICEGLDGNAFTRLTSGGGQVFPRPHLLKVMPWEYDEARCASMEQRIGEAEIASGVPMGRVVMASAHNIGRAFNLSTRTLRAYPLVRLVLKDNKEPYRIARRLFHFADEVLAATKPDIVFAFDWATPLNFSVWMIANQRGIPCFALRHCKINADRGFLTPDRVMLNRAAIARGQAKRLAAAPVSDAAKKHVQVFRERPSTIRFIAIKWQSRMRRGFVRWHLITARVLVRQFIDRFRGQDQALQEPPLRRILRYYRTLFLTYWQQRYLRSFDEEELGKMKYIYFSLHKEAELAKTFQTTLWHDQRNTIRVLASMLPFGYRLLVREHRMNYGNRPTRSYRELLQLPNVIMLDPFDSQFKYLRHADLIVTENSSSGWEGLLMKRRVLMLAEAFYDGAGLAAKVRDPDLINRAILECLSKPPVIDEEAHDHALGCMVDGELETTFPMNEEGMPEALNQLATMVRGASAKPQTVTVTDT